MKAHEIAEELMMALPNGSLKAKSILINALQNMVDDEENSAENLRKAILHILGCGAIPVINTRRVAFCNNCARKYCTNCKNYNLYDPNVYSYNAPGFTAFYYGEKEKALREAKEYCEISDKISIGMTIEVYGGTTLYATYTKTEEGIKENENRG